MDVTGLLCRPINRCLICPSPGETITTSLEAVVHANTHLVGGAKCTWMSLRPSSQVSGLPHQLSSRILTRLLRHCTYGSCHPYMMPPAIFRWIITQMLRQVSQDMNLLHLKSIHSFNFDLVAVDCYPSLVWRKGNVSNW
jgi:hypothetical protein